MAADGSSIPQDGLIEMVSLNKDGKATCKTDLPFGRFYLQEISTDSHYQLGDTKYPVSFDYAGQDKKLVKLIANEGAVIENKLIYGSVSGLKVDATISHSPVRSWVCLLHPKRDSRRIPHC